jgi:hypothetical protein
MTYGSCLQTKKVHISLIFRVRPVLKTSAISFSDSNQQPIVEQHLAAQEELLSPPTDSPSNQTWDAGEGPWRAEGAGGGSCDHGPVRDMVLVTFSSSEYVKS